MMNSTVSAQPNNKVERISFSKLMSQSTVYKRNEARLVKSFSLKHDRRPAAIRVLSSLSLSRSEPSCQTHPRVVPIEPGFSNETVFHCSADLLAPPSSSRIHPSPLSNVFLFTSFGGAASQVVFGSRSARSMPMQQNEGRIAHMALEGGHANNNSAFVRLPGQYQQQMAVTKINHFQVAASAAIAGVLFGSKVVFSRSLGDDQNKPFALTSLASSALAGAAKATLSVPLQTIRCFQFLACEPLRFGDALALFVRNQGIQGLYMDSRNVFSGEMLGAIMYFSTYEAVKSYLSPKNNEKPVSSFAIGASGAVAGVVYQTALKIFSSSLQPTNLMTFLRGHQQVFSPSLGRAVPIHAALFLCYESAVRATHV